MNRRDNDFPNDSAGADAARHTPTHAGALVWRPGAVGPLFLLVTANSARHEWVLPKGHIEAGESPRQTAQREVREETGLDVEVGDYLGTETFFAKGSTVVCAYYLARCAEDMHGEAAGQTSRGGFRTAAPEGRLMAWLPLEDAISRSTFPAGRTMLRSARERWGTRNR